MKGKNELKKQKNFNLIKTVIVSFIVLLLTAIAVFEVVQYTGKGNVETRLRKTTE